MLLVLVLFFGISGCMTAEVRDRICRNENYINQNINAIDDAAKRTDGLENRVAALEKSQIDTNGAIASLDSRVAKNEVVISRVEGKLSSLQKEVYRRLGILSDQSQILYKNFDGRQAPLMVGPFVSGSATEVISKTGKPVCANIQIAEVSKCLGKKCINGVTVTMSVCSIVAGHDVDPIKKSGWVSNEELARARGVFAANNLGVKEDLVLPCLDPKRHGLGKTDNRYVYIFFEARKW